MVNTKVVVAGLIYTIDKFLFEVFSLSNICFKFTYFEIQMFEMFKQSWMEMLEN